MRKSGSGVSSCSSPQAPPLHPAANPPPHPTLPTPNPLHTRSGDSFATVLGGVAYPLFVGEFMRRAAGKNGLASAFLDWPRAALGIRSPASISASNSLGNVFRFALAKCSSYPARNNPTAASRSNR